mgnify:CR=1 FL=1
MDCDAFFDRVEDRLGGAVERSTRTRTSHQCVFDFFHPRTTERLGADGLVTAFNRSGVVWAPPARRLGVQLRVPAAVEESVARALAAAPFPAERTDHRGAAAPDGEMVSLVHFAVRASDVTDDQLTATLDAVADAVRI